MGAESDFDRRALESALEWWRDAGVDAAVEDAPCDWFAKASPLSLAPSPAPVGEPEDAALLPENWDDFLAWRNGRHAPEASWLGAGVLASGPADATVMALSDVPDRDDCERGLLLSGEAGRLFDRMLAAIGLSRESVHLASVCAKRPAGGRVSRSDQERLGEVARRHVELVSPERLLLMGDAASRAVLGTEALRARGRVHVIKHRSGRTEVVASFHPRFLLANPGRKREAWIDLQMLIRGSGE